MRPIQITVKANTGGAEAALKRVTNSTRRLDNQIRGAGTGMNQYGRTVARSNTQMNRWARGALQQSGYQIGDFAVQVANGTNKLQAFGQQAPQLLQVFGPIGSIVGAAVAVLAAFGVIASKTGKNIENLGSAFGVLEAPMRATIASLAALKESFGSVLPAIRDNIDTVIIAAGLYVAWIGVKMVAASLAAATSTISLTGSFTSVRFAIFHAAGAGKTWVASLLIMKLATLQLGAALLAVGKLFLRFLPVLIIVGLAKAIELFMRLKAGAGSFGEALKLLSDVAVEAWDRMKDGLWVLGIAFTKTARQLKLAFVKAFAFVQSKWAALVGSIANTGVAKRFGLLQGVREDVLATEQSYKESIASIEHELQQLDGFMASKRASMTAPFKSWQKLKDAVKAGTVEVSIFGAKTEEVSEDSQEKLKKIHEQVQSIADSIKESMSSAFMGMIEGTKSAKQAFTEMARSIIKQLYDVLVVQQLVGSFNASTGSGTGLVGMIMGGISGGSTGGILGGLSGARAMGGPVSAGKSYLVGERGPELFVPGRNGTVAANGSGSSGVVVHQTINIETGVSQTVRAEITSLMPRITEASKQAVYEARRRGGGFAEAF